MGNTDSEPISYQTPQQQFIKPQLDERHDSLGQTGSPFVQGNEPSLDAPAQPMLSNEEYLKLWKSEDDQTLKKFRRLAYEVLAFISVRPNAIDKLMSACNKVPISIESVIEPVNPASKKVTSPFKCYVYMEKISVATGEGVRKDESKRNAFEAALRSFSSSVCWSPPSWCSGPSVLSTAVAAPA